MKTYTQIVETIVQDHFSQEPQLTKILLFSSENEKVIRLLEVNDATIPTGSVDAFLMSIPDCPYPVYIADVTFKEWGLIRKELIPLPKNWPAKPIEEFNSP